MVQTRSFKCYTCGHEWQVPFGTGRPSRCPRCSSTNMHRSALDRGPRKGLCGRHGSGGQTCIERGRGEHGRGFRGGA